jgi:hypothetical protein
MKNWPSSAAGALFFTARGLAKMSDSKDKNKDHDLELKLRERELILKVTKEIVVKFIEMGRVTPISFEEVFELVYQTVASAKSRCSR